MFFYYIFKYDDFFDGDDDELLYLTQVAEIETRIPQSYNVVNSRQTTDANQHNIIVNKPSSSIPKNNNIKTNNHPTSTTRQAKISDMLGPSTSTMSSNSIDKPTGCPNELNKKIEKNNTTVKQASGKRLASSPVYTETKKPLFEHYIPENIWDDIMDVDIIDSSVKVLKSASVVKNSKIQVKQNKWICSGIVTDEIGHKEVEFSSDVS